MAFAAEMASGTPPRHLYIHIHTSIYTHLCKYELHMCLHTYTHLNVDICVYTHAGMRRLFAKPIAKFQNSFVGVLDVASLASYPASANPTIPGSIWLFEGGFKVSSGTV